MSQSALKKGLELCSDHDDQKTYIMYHGTTLENARKIMRNGFIRSSRGMLGPGVYVTRSNKKARAYPKCLQAGQKRAVLELSVRVGKVKKIKRQGHPLQKSWHEKGYDSAWVPPNCGMVKSGLEENCVWDPNRITVLKIMNEDGSSEEPQKNEHGKSLNGNNQNGDNQLRLFQPGLYQHGHYQHGHYQHGLYQHGLYQNDLYRHDLYRHDLYLHDLYLHDLYLHDLYRRELYRRGLYRRRIYRYDHYHERWQLCGYEFC